MSKFEYRIFGDFNHDQFIMDMQAVDFSYVHSVGADANTAYDKFEHQISQVVDKHAPIKQAYQGRMKLSCMNSNLKSNFLKKEVFNEYKK